MKWNFECCALANDCLHPRMQRRRKDFRFHRRPSSLWRRSYPHEPSAFVAARISPSNERENGETFIVLAATNSVSHFIDGDPVVPRLKHYFRGARPQTARRSSAKGSMGSTVNLKTRGPLPGTVHATRTKTNFRSGYPRQSGLCLRGREPCASPGIFQGPLVRTGRQRVLFSQMSREDQWHLSLHSTRDRNRSIDLPRLRRRVRRRV